MGDVLSLRLARKRQARAQREEQAAENRARFGRTKAEKKLTDATRDKAEKELDGHKREE